MIQKLGGALKKMAQRSMMRGNRGDAQAITDFGMVGARSNLQTQPQNTITEHLQTGNTGVHEVFVKETTDNVKSNIANAAVHHLQKTNNQPAKKLGGSIMDALQ